MRRSTLFALALLLSAAPATLASAQNGACGASHTIARGDTLSKIAERCGVSLSALQAANPNAQPRRLRVGAELMLPGAEAQGDAMDPAGGAAEGYTIRAGDTLYAIARRNNLELAALMEANPGIRPRRLQIGQVIQMPGAAGMMTAEAAPERMGVAPGMAEAGPGAMAAESGGTEEQRVAGGEDSAAAGAGSLSITPASGPAGTTVDMRGQGFDPGERVTLVLGVDQQPGTEFAAVEADPEGRIAVRMAIPEAVQPGQRLAFAAVGANGTRPMDVFLVSAPGTQPGAATPGAETPLAPRPQAPAATPAPAPPTDPTPDDSPTDPDGTALNR